jgi:2-polyprenyl-3-methyl-5-hydroxy-6-metoxy-1,4-benzoquinol methylase
MKNLRDRLASLLQPKGKTSFLMSMALGARVLDVGCGNDSPSRTKKSRPDLYYVGIDIDHSNTGTRHGYENADEFYLTHPDEFHNKIFELRNQFDYIISSHNIEHCYNRESVLRAMASSLKSGGVLYLSYPSKASINFPHRRGPLNYYDEKEHTETPPDTEYVIKLLNSMSCDVEFMSESYRPILMRVIGLLLEIPSKALNRTLTGTWQLYGFETIMWIKKRK